MSELAELPFYNFLPLEDLESDKTQQVNEYFRQIDDSVRWLFSNSPTGGTPALIVALDITNTYDPVTGRIATITRGGATWVISRDGDGRIGSMTDGSTTRTFTYRPTGQVLTMTVS